ncbi:Chchd3p [Mactra antiquata]
MGGSQSTHSVVVDNPNSIMLTQDAYRRITGMPEKQKTDKEVTMTNEQIDAMRKQIENEYRQRFTNQSDESRKISAQEFSRAVQEVESKFLKQSSGPVCEDLLQSVYQCYQNNKSEPLRCSQQVRAFTDAVEKARQNAVMTKKS